MSYPLCCATLPRMTDSEDEYLAVESAGNIAGISPRTLRYWIKGGKLPAIEGPKGKLVKLADVLAIAEMTGKRPQPVADERQTAGNADEAARSAADPAGNATGNTAEALPAISPQATAQLAAIRDEWLAPLVDRIGTLERELGRVEQERDTLRAEVERLQSAAKPLRDEEDDDTASPPAAPRPWWRRLLWGR